MARQATNFEGLPPEAYSIWESYPWRFGKAFCIIKALFAEMTSYASVLTITAFTIERYIAICKPLKSHKIVAFSRCIKIIIAIWVISLCCALPYPIHTDLFYYVHDDAGNPIQDSLQCNIPPQYDERMMHVFQLSTFVFFVFPLTVIVVLYSLIGCTLRKAELSREPSHKRCHGSGRHNSQGQHERSPTFIARRSVLKVLVAVVVAFFVCWAPFHAQRLLTVYNRHWTPLLFDVQSSLFYVSGVLYFVGSTVNPILYNVMSRRYRLAFLETICHSTNRHTYSSYRHTNGGTSLKRKQSSLKGSLKWNDKGYNKHEDCHKHKTDMENSRYKRFVERCRHYGNDENLAQADGTKALCDETKDCIKLDGIARVRSYKGGFNQQEIKQAERKHAAKCAQNGHVVDYVQLRCTNLVDIPPLCLVDNIYDHCSANDYCEDLKNATNESVRADQCNDTSSKDYVVKTQTQNINGSCSCKNIISDKSGLKSDSEGVFV
ncbi:neuropeptides capa receptor-like isoform X2 [Mercenaria mercenaria]|uniref:neuropeptides capa receptor-like isoform X2 n=1 Tax=Mercenaria mercenaria TaxID=6596 RepID=UPI001E1D6300|nr:neuropeptides capa receptor-like isoform X2 [Mercenaria mercenaria]